MGTLLVSWEHQLIEQNPPNKWKAKKYFIFSTKFLSYHYHLSGCEVHFQTKLLVLYLHRFYLHVAFNICKAGCQNGTANRLLQTLRLVAYRGSVLPSHRIQPWKPYHIGDPMMLATLATQAILVTRDDFIQEILGPGNPGNLGDLGNPGDTGNPGGDPPKCRSRFHIIFGSVQLGSVIPLIWFFFFLIWVGHFFLF